MLTELHAVTVATADKQVQAVLRVGDATSTVPHVFFMPPFMARILAEKLLAAADQADPPRPQSTQVTA